MGTVCQYGVNATVEELGDDHCQCVLIVASDGWQMGKA